MNVTEPTGDVQKQITLPWRQVARIALNSIRVRIFRSAITIAMLTLAISFVVYTWAGYEILNSVFPHLKQADQDQILLKGFEASSGGQFGTGPKEIWLMLLSVLVCITGIINAHLMSVTERFREIGTLKCLGALDSFIIKIFLLEAAYQGMLAGIAGSFLGVLTATVSCVLSIGFVVLSYWPVLRLWALFGTALLFAVFLSTLGVIYPALVAARMQPAAAMRSEQ
jgi:ABC-type antimicrobial peptide transport system permease subunit